MPPLVAAAAITAGGAIAGGAMSSRAAGKSAKLQTDAANHAADVNKQAADERLAFERSQAEQVAKQAEIDRKANYDQWAAGQAQHNRVREALGYPTTPIPPYVPSAPANFGGTPAPTTGAPPNTTMPVPGAPAPPRVVPTSMPMPGTVLPGMQPALMPSVGAAMAPRPPMTGAPAPSAPPAASVAPLAMQPMPAMPRIGSVDDYLTRGAMAARGGY